MLCSNRSALLTGLCVAVLGCGGSVPPPPAPATNPTAGPPPATVAAPAAVIHPPPATVAPPAVQATNQATVAGSQRAPLLPSGKDVRWEGAPVVERLATELKSALPPTGTFFIKDGHVIDLLTGKKSPRLEINEDEASGSLGKHVFQMEVSPDGKVVAVWKKSPEPENQDSKPLPAVVRLLAVNTGKVVQKIEIPIPGYLASVASVKKMRFAGPRILATICENSDNHFYITFNVASAAEIMRQALPYPPDPSALWFSDDMTLAVGQQGAVMAVASLVDAKVLSQLEIPAGCEKLLRDFLRFSPDNQEIAACYRGRLLVWNCATGKLTIDHPVPTNLDTVPVAWEPTGRGWLIDHRFLLLRDPLVIAWFLTPGTCRDSRFIDHDTLLWDEHGTAYAIRVPWPEIDKALASHSPPATRAKFGDRVRLDLSIGEVRYAGKEEATKQLQQDVEKLIVRSGYQIDPQATLVAKVTYGEGAGETKEVVKGLGVNAPRTGQSIEDTTTALVIELHAPEGPIWRYEDIHKGTSLIFGEASASGVRREAFDGTLSQLGRTMVPSLFPAVADASRLPIRTHIPGAIERAARGF